MKTKYNVIFLLVALFPNLMSAQYTLKKENNAPRAGDEIIKQQVQYKDPGRSGENVIWNFGNLSSVNDSYILTYSEPSIIGDTVFIMGLDTLRRDDFPDNLIVGTEHNTMYYYRLQDDAILCLGHENPVTILKYDRPLLHSVFSLKYGDSYNKEYSSSGMYSSTSPIQSEGVTNISADAHGMIVLPSGDTLKNIVRTKNSQIITEEINNENDTLLITNLLENYKWYLKGYRYPVFETVRMFQMKDDGLEENFGTSFFYPPQEHYYIDSDEANLLVLDSLKNENIPGEYSDWLKRNFSYNYFPNPVVYTLNIEYHLEEAADVEIILYDSFFGNPLRIPKRRKQPGTYSESIDCSSLRSGTYILHIIVRGEIVKNIILRK